MLLARLFALFVALPLGGAVLACSPPASPPSPSSPPLPAASPPVASSTAAPAPVAPAAPPASTAPRKPPAGDPSPEARTSTTGLGIEDLVIGKGPRVEPGSQIKVLYEGRLLDGTLFDGTSQRHDEPFSVTIGKGMLIKGWEEGMLGMQAGGKRRLTVPSHLGYGTHGRPPKIQPGATLIFVVELLAVSP
jgi:FKBP-type peptidyl-prolyl cis-trans isomerase